MIKIAIAEDNTFLLDSLREKLSFYPDFLIKFHGYNGAELIEKVNEDHNVDIILMDIQMPGMDGIEATAIIKSKFPHIKIIILTVFDDDENVFNAIKAGADGYLLKETKAEQLRSGINDIMEGGASMSPSIALKTLKLLRNPVSVALNKPEEIIELSVRETEILEHLSKGLNYQKIADNLFVAPATVRKHIENLYKKLQVHNKIEAIQKATRHRLIS